MVPLEKIGNIASSLKNTKTTDCIYEITFTMDDYVYLNIYEITAENTITKNIKSSKFYLTDNSNNDDLVYNLVTLTSKRQALKKDIVEKLSEVRKTVIAQTGMKEISYAVNKHNTYAKSVGINYTFSFSVESDASWYETMDGIGAIAIIQGISLGNRYLNYKAYSASDLVMTKKYYVSEGIKIEGRNLAYFEKNLYHLSNSCPVYEEYINKTNETLVPKYYTKKANAATQGFYPCPICKP